MRIVAFILLVGGILSNVWKNPVWASGAGVLFYFAIPMREFHMPTLPYQAASFALAMALAMRNRHFVKEEAYEEIATRALTVARDVVAAFRKDLLDAMSVGIRDTVALSSLTTDLLKIVHDKAQPLARDRICGRLVTIVVDAVTKASESGVLVGVGEVERIHRNRRSDTSIGMMVATLNAQALPALDRATESALEPAIRDRLAASSDAYDRATRLAPDVDLGPLGMPIARRAIFALFTNVGLWAHLGFTIATHISASHARWSVEAAQAKLSVCWLLLIPLVGIICGARSPSQFRMTTWAWILGAAMICYNGVTLWQAHGGRADDVGGQQSDANFLGIVAVGIAPIALSMFVHESNRYVRLAGLSFGGLATLAVLASGSRGALIALVGATGVWLLLSGKKAIAGAIVAFAATAFFAVAPDTFWERMGTVILPKDKNTWLIQEHEESARSRKIFWSLAWTTFQESPYVGIGPMNFPLENEVRAWYVSTKTGGKRFMTHSTWLQLLSEWGSLGSFFWIGGYIFSMVAMLRAAHIVRRLRGDPFYGWMQAYFIGFFCAWVGNAVAISFVSCQWLDYNYWILVMGPLGLQMARDAAVRARWFAPSEGRADDLADSTSQGRAHLPTAVRR